MDNYQQEIAKNRHLFDTIAVDWDAAANDDSAKINIILDLAALNNSEQVLDIGTGTGVLLPYLQELKIGQITALDLSEQMLALAKTKNKAANINFVCGDILDFKQTGFCAAIMFNCYPHFPDKPALALHLANILADGGRFIIAHSSSAAQINAHHQSEHGDHIAASLQPAFCEQKIWQEHFNIDILVDTEQMYIISGTKNG